MATSAFHCPCCASCIGHFKTEVEFRSTYPNGCPLCNRCPDPAARKAAKDHHDSKKQYPKSHADALAARETMMEGS